MSKSAILCVDDEIVVLNSLKIQLKKEFGDTYAYEVAESADEALEVIEELKDEETDILVIVSDWLMPGIKGDEFLIKVHEKYPNIVKVMLTGQADESAIDRAKKKAELHACLHKPWDRKELISTIKSGLKKS
ncbi:MULTISPECIES: response regulator [Kamptonema]|uniref:response regulator n=1 Tax=Kamptonema TaxID=1501433 RepID=UPI0001DAD46A|nr:MULTISPECIES: response regulator [Kamptonema]CBN55244.1 Response regulator receiver [Kamptonema sp. PCC 6506]